ncbi:MAG: hypothetical protein ACRED1_04120, partial [Limisphaerales bacterium]
MNNPNPFVPQGSLLEQQSKRRSRLKLGVLCVLAVGVAGLSAMLIQGCKREQENPPESENNPPPMQTNETVGAETNLSGTEESNTATEAAPPEGSQPPPIIPAPESAVPAAPAPTEREYVVVKGDYMQKIARKNGVTVKA